MPEHDREGSRGGAAVVQLDTGVEQAWPYRRALDLANGETVAGALEAVRILDEALAEQLRPPAIYVENETDDTFPLVYNGEDRRKEDTSMAQPYETGGQAGSTVVTPALSTANGMSNTANNRFDPAQYADHPEAISPYHNAVYHLVRAISYGYHTSGQNTAINHPRIARLGHWLDDMNAKRAAWSQRNHEAFMRGVGYIANRHSLALRVELPGYAHAAKKAWNHGREQVSQYSGRPNLAVVQSADDDQSNSRVAPGDRSPEGAGPNPNAYPAPEETRTAQAAA